MPVFYGRLFGKSVPIPCNVNSPSEGVLMNNIPVMPNLSARVGVMNSHDSFMRTDTTNAALKQFISNYWGDNGSQGAARNVLTSLDLLASPVSGSTSYGMWDEGGMTKSRYGFGIIFADFKGRRITPITVNSLPRTANGRHALVPVNAGEYVLCGTTRAGEECVGIYQVEDVVVPENDDPKFIAELVAYRIKSSEAEEPTFCDRNNNPFSIEVLGWEDDPIRALVTQIHTIGAKHPGYVRPYREKFVDIQDARDILDDQELISKAQACSSLEELYDAATEILREYYTEFTKERYPAVTTIVSDYGNGTLGVYLAASIYDKTSKSSKGARYFYGYAALHEDFYPIDRGPTIPTHELQKKMQNNTVVLQHQLMVL